MMTQVNFDSIGGGGKAFALITNGSSYGGAYTLFNKDGSLNKTVKLPYNTSTTPVNDDYCTITGTTTSDSITFKKACTSYTNNQNIVEKPFNILDVEASITAGTVISNFYSNMNFRLVVFNE